MSEITLYEAQKKKLQGLCEEHDLTFRFRKDSYPITLSISPLQGMDAQMSMLEDVETVGYRSPDASMTWIFEDGNLTTKVSGGTFTISKVLRTKIESVLLKMISYWQQYFFRDVIEKDALRKGMMPVINEAEANDLPDGAEPLEEDDGEIPGYCFCIIEEEGGGNLRPMKTLYIDDLCVDETRRGEHIGSQLYAYVKHWAAEQGFYRITLNVWERNAPATAFYRHLGLKPLKTTMEELL